MNYHSFPLDSYTSAPSWSKQHDLLVISRYYFDYATQISDLQIHIYFVWFPNVLVRKTYALNIQVIEFLHKKDAQQCQFVSVMSTDCSSNDYGGRVGPNEGPSVYAH